MVHEPLEADDGVSGSFNGPDPGNPCGWLTPEHVLSAIIDGNAFVNIHRELPRRRDPGTSEGRRSRVRGPARPGSEVQDPAVVSDGEGESEFTWRNGRIRYAVEWEDLTSAVVAGHIHCAPAGSNGPVGVTLVHEPLDADDRVRGSFTGPDLPNDCMWDSLGDVLAAMLTGMPM